MNPFYKELFAGKHIIVTGATSGAGRAATLLLNSLGATLTAFGRDDKKLQELQKEIMMLPATGSTIHTFVSADFSKELSIDAWSRYKAIDGIFHAAGTELIKPLRTLKMEDISNVFNVSFLSGIQLLQHVAHKGSMNDKGGSIVIMSSVSASHGVSGMTGYSATKAAIEGLVRSAAVELAPQAIRVNAIAAGAFRSPMHERLTKTLTQEAQDAYLRKHPLGFGDCEDVANVAAYLLCDAAKWVTGATWVVDGGYMNG